MSTSAAAHLRTYSVPAGWSVPRLLPPHLLPMQEARRLHASASATGTVSPAGIVWGGDMRRPCQRRRRKHAAAERLPSVLRQRPGLVRRQPKSVAIVAGAPTRPTPRQIP